MPDFERLDAVLAYHDAHPDEHDQGVFGSWTVCGTTCCTAGRAVIMFAPERVKWIPDRFLEPGGMKLDPLPDGSTPIDELASSLLGLTQEQAVELFYDAKDQAACRRIVERWKREASGEDPA